jgi:predicted RNA binding protein YcfA (HicA-like mRNA interferase family)
VRLPRDVSGAELAKLLARYGYHITRQTGSHHRLTTTLRGEHHITVHLYSSLKVGTLSGILTDVADHMQIPKETLVRELFHKP